jgi:phosphoribosylanthranilate isomerase
MTVSVKICGINSREAAEAAMRARAEFAGLVFFPRSPRKLTLDDARALIGVLRGRTKIVALFADAGDYDIEAVVRKVKPDVLQIHGGESPDRVGAIGARFKLPVIRAIGVATADDLAAAHVYEDAAAYLLFDAKHTGAERPGGHGVAFDWKLLASHSFKRPWFLGGGLNADNVARAIQISGAQMVDVSSGVEDSPGIKNPDKIIAFAKAARSAQYTSTNQADLGE